MTQERQIGYLIFDKLKQRYLSREGIGFGWSMRKNKSAVLTKEQAGFWVNQLVKINQRGGFSVLQVESRVVA